MLLLELPLQLPTWKRAGWAYCRWRTASEKAGVHWLDCDVWTITSSTGHYPETLSTPGSGQGGRTGGGAQRRRRRRKGPPDQQVWTPPHPPSTPSRHRSRRARPPARTFMLACGSDQGAGARKALAPPDLWSDYVCDLPSASAPCWPCGPTGDLKPHAAFGASYLNAFADENEALQIDGIPGCCQRWRPSRIPPIFKPVGFAERSSP